MQLLGFNYRMTDIQAALGLSQLKKLERFIAERNASAAYYDRAFRGMAHCTVPSRGAGVRHAYHLYPLRIDFERLKLDKAAFFAALKAKGIFCQVHYLPVYQHPYYRSMPGAVRQTCRNAERFYAQEISLPIYPGLSASDRAYVVRAVKRNLRKP